MTAYDPFRPVIGFDKNMAKTAEEKLAARQERWKKTQRDGIWRFALIEGVLKWGIGTAILWLVLMTVVSEGGLDYGFYAPYALITFPVGGFFFGIIMWYALHGLNQLAKKLANRK